MNTSNVVDFASVSIVAVGLLIQSCGSALERIEDAKSCHAMNTSCPTDRRNVIVRGVQIICTCNEDRPKP